jgi:hypothetical protein
LNIFFRSFRTKSYWKSLLLSTSTWANFFAIVGALYLFADLLDFFRVVPKEDYPENSAAVLLLLAAVVAVALKRPVSKIVFKVPKRDLNIEVRVGDLFKSEGDIVVSTNTTFDTDTTNSLISSVSLQGQFSSRYFAGRLADLDRQIDEALAGVASAPVDRGWGKAREYPIGTVARLDTHGQTFYWLAMARLDENKTARASLEGVDKSLEALWSFVAQRGEMSTVVMPVIGTGRGRLTIQRRKMIERIVQSFVDSSREKAFAKGLTIVVHPDDAEKSELNLFEVKDHLKKNVDT